MLFYCVDLPYCKKWVPASQHLKVIRNGMMLYNNINSCSPFKNDNINYYQLFGRRHVRVGVNLYPVIVVSRVLAR